MQRHVGPCASWLVAGVGVVAAQQCPVGAADLGLGRVAFNSQDGVEVGAFGRHGQIQPRVESWSRPGRSAETTTVRRTGARPATTMRRWARRRARCDGRLGCERAGGATGHLRVGSPVAITFPSLVGLVGRSGRGGGERCRTHPPMVGGHRPGAGSRTPWAPRRRALGTSRLPGTPPEVVAGGGVGHSAAMIASNSAASSSWSWQISSRNCRSVRSPASCVVGMTEAPIRRRWPVGPHRCW